MVDDTAFHDEAIHRVHGPPNSWMPPASTAHPNSDLLAHHPPQMGPPLASLGIFTSCDWNDYLWPLIVLTSPEKRTIPLLLVCSNPAHLQPGTHPGSIHLTLLPIFLVYIFLPTLDRGPGDSKRI